jgi:predicted amidophosphoribosyltransferase
LDDTTPLIEARIDSKMNKLKNISIKAKLHFCKEMYTPDKVSLATSVSSRNIVVIDDLYQSGTTLWSYAQYLKNMGAAKVIGLVCEKNFRDSDNL